MTAYKYLIIGGGMTADAAARAIRESDPPGNIGIISADSHPPYNRPPLSKGLWKGDDPEKTVWRRTDTIGVDLRLGRRATALNPKQKSVTDDRGNIVSYEKLLLATGGSPRRLPMQTGQIIYYRTFDDYLRLRALANEKLRFVVLGGGFIGSEIAAALRLVGRDVTMIVPEDGIGARHPLAGRTRGQREHHGRRRGPRAGRHRHALHAPALLLFGSVRARLRSSRRAGSAARNRCGLEGAIPRRGHLLSQGRQSARRVAVEYLGPGGQRAGDHRHDRPIGMTNVQ